MEAVMDRKVIDDITSRFQALAALVPLHAIRTDADYDKAVTVLNQLLDAGAADELSPLADLTNALGSLIGDFEDVNNSPQEVAPAATLRFLMEQHNLTQSDLPEIGSQGVVSEILRGKRDLNVRQIKKLAGRFHVPAAVFI
jgi:HTH-type transcriptional regulator/antitoxin HigA